MGYSGCEGRFDHGGLEAQEGVADYRDYVGESFPCFQQSVQGN